MKLAITSRGETPDAEVDPRFGRGKYFIIYDTDTDGFEVMDNADQEGADQGAGVQAAQNVASSGAKALLTGHCGPKAFEVLSAAGIEVYSGIEGTVRDAVEAWRKGSLERLEGPDGSPRH